MPIFWQQANNAVKELAHDLGIDRSQAAKLIVTGSDPDFPESTSYLFGGNWNFKLSADALALYPELGAGHFRLPDSTIHLSDPGYFHVDTANPEPWWKFGIMGHLEDVVTGWTVYKSSGIPRP